MRALLLGAFIATAATAQDAPRLSAERADFSRWLETSPVSPFAALYHQPLAGELVFGPGGEPGLEALPAATLREERRRVALRTSEGTRSLPRNRDVPLGEWRIRVNGDRGRSSVTVFGAARDVAIPGWYPHAPDLSVDGTLERPERRESRRMLALDGVEVEASRAGTFAARVAGQPVRLTVFRIPEPGTEESELMIFFRDETNGAGSYPAGRFLALQPLGGARYRADFNRARNPFCAYNGIFPCPLPWAGNVIAAPLEVGERYEDKRYDDK
jgi:hypothetical protein